MEISALIQGYNEEKQLPRLFESLKDIKDIVFIDHESTDKTAEVAKKLGANVITREFPFDIATQDDVKEFKKRYGFMPQFKAGDKIRKSGYERYKTGTFTKNDWILNVDCDEIVTWNIQKVKELLPEHDVIRCRFYHEHTPNGERKDFLYVSKLYNRQKTWWFGRVHEAITGNHLRSVISDDIEIDHWQTLKPYRSGYIGILEYSVLYDQDPRFLFYLGREYYNNSQWQRAVQLLTTYIPVTNFLQEKVKAYVIIAASYFNLGEEDEAFIFCTQALKTNPNAKQAYELMAEMSNLKNRNLWLKHAAIAESDHYL